jgi:hypothetical protein
MPPRFKDPQLPDTANLVTRSLHASTQIPSRTLSAVRIAKTAKLLLFDFLELLEGILKIYS